MPQRKHAFKRSEKMPRLPSNSALKRKLRLSDSALRLRLRLRQRLRSSVYKRRQIKLRKIDRKLRPPLLLKRRRQPKRPLQLKRQRQLKRQLQLKRLKKRRSQPKKRRSQPRKRKPRSMKPTLRLTLTRGNQMQRLRRPMTASRRTLWPLQWARRSLAKSVERKRTRRESGSERVTGRGRAQPTRGYVEAQPTIKRKRN